MKNNQDDDLNDNKLSNDNSITINQNPTLENHVANQKYVDNSTVDENVLRFNQTLENYLKISVGNVTYNLTKYDKIQITDTTIIKSGNSQSTVLPYWRVICNDRINNGKISKIHKNNTNKQSNW